MTSETHNPLTARDLTVGCYVQDEKGNVLKVAQVCESSQFCIYRDANNKLVSGIDISQPFGIQPSPAWLKRLGLLPEQGTYDTQYFALPTNRRISVEWARGKATLFDGPIAFKPIPSIHYLQRLVYDLEGVWLEILKTT